MRKSLGRSRIKPTVSVMITSRSFGKRNLRLVGSRVAKSRFSALNFAVGQCVEQGGFTSIGVAHNGDHRQPAAAAALAAALALAGDLLEIALQTADALRTRRRSTSSWVSPGLCRRSRR